LNYLGKKKKGKVAEEKIELSDDESDDERDKSTRLVSIYYDRIKEIRH
jgi:hypothetical protein